MNDILKHFLLSSLIFFIFIIFSILFNQGSTYYETTNNVIAFMGGSYFMSSITHKPLNYFINSLQFFLPSYLLTDKTHLQYKLCIEKYTKIKDYITDDEKKMIENHLIQMYKYREKIDIIDKYYEHLLVIFKILEKVDLDDLDTNKINNKIKKDSFDFLNNENITKDNKQDILDNIIIPFYNNIINHNIINNIIPISPIYIVGSSGTGKTTFVNNLAEELEIPIIKLKISDINVYEEQFNPEMFNGSTNINTMTKIYMTLKMNKTNNIIVFIDEFDKIFYHKGTNHIDKLLTLFNSCKSSIFDNNLQLTIPIHNIIVICCGNQLPSELDKIYEAFDNRFTIIRFNNKTYEQKLEICLKEFVKKRNLTDENREFIKDFVLKDKDNGLRKVLVKLNNYICKLNIMEMNIMEMNN